MGSPRGRGWGLELGEGTRQPQEIRGRAEKCNVCISNFDQVQLQKSYWEPVVKNSDTFLPG